MPYGIRKPLILLGFALLATAPSIQAEVLQIRVTDDAGQALADAVLMAKGASPTVNPEPAVMDQVDKAFVPHVLIVEQGRAVRFPNSDDIRHHVYSFSKPKPFEIKLYAGSQQAPVIFDKPGIVALGCNIHDWMIGYIVISDTAAVTKTNNDGSAVLDITDKSAPIRVWHPRLLQGAQAAVEMPLPTPDAAGNITIKLSLKPAPAAKPASGFDNRLRGYAK